jgi:hypothetical protein
MKADTGIYRKILKTILWIYIILCVIIAGVNYGYAAKAPANIQRVIAWIWMIYENWVKTIFIVVCTFLTLKIVGASGRTEMRKRNLIGFILAALAVHVLTPILVNNYEMYFTRCRSRGQRLRFSFWTGIRRFITRRLRHGAHPVSPRR